MKNYVRFSNPPPLLQNISNFLAWFEIEKKKYIIKRNLGWTDQLLLSTNGAQTSADVIKFLKWRGCINKANRGR